jgi:hypothetical protein
VHFGNSSCLCRLGFEEGALTIGFKWISFLLCFSLLYSSFSLILLDLSLSAVNAGMNKAASSGTSLNTKRLDDDTENLAREQSSVSGHFSHEQSDRRFFVPRIPIDKFGHLSTVDVINDLYMFMFTSLAVDDVFF